VTASDVLARLGDRGLTLAVAESLTGGRLAASFTAVPGASRVFRGGVVSYATDVKRDVLGVSAALIDEQGVVSADVASAMAHGVRRLLDADVALATTGVAGPDRQEGKPVGTVYVALASATHSAVERLELSGDREDIQLRASEGAVALLAAWLEGRLSGEQPPLG
jgi:PncC family amidohydrolase